MAVLLQVIIYNVIVQPLKLIKRNKSLWEAFIIES
jgi:hypothetical protein